jgi:hypothetical protein
MVLRSARRPAAPMRLLARPLTSTPRALLPHVPSKREEECRRPASPFLLPSAGLHTTPPLEHGYVNKKFPNRPISPHVMIYAFPVVAISSITMRISGVMLSVGCAGIAGMACVDPAMPSELMSYLSTHSLLAIPTKAAVSFTLIYHFIVACRHTVRPPDAQPAPHSPVAFRLRDPSLCVPACPCCARARAETDYAPVRSGGTRLPPG